MIDCHDGSIELGFYCEKVKFKISNTAKYPEEGHSINFIDIVNPLVKAIMKDSRNLLGTVLKKSSTRPHSQGIAGQTWGHSRILEKVEGMGRVQTPTGGIHANTAYFPSVRPLPDLDLEPLSDPLKRANLGNAKKPL